MYLVDCCLTSLHLTVVAKLHLQVGELIPVPAGDPQWLYGMRFPVAMPSFERLPHVLLPYELFGSRCAISSLSIEEVSMARGFCFRRRPRDGLVQNAIESDDLISTILQ